MSSPHLLSPSSDGSMGDLDLDHSLMKQVQLAIRRVAETQQDTEEVTGLPSTSSRESAATRGQVTESELETQCGECRDEIHRLREEIRLLEDEVGRREAPLQLVTDDQLQRHLLALDDSTHQPMLEESVSDNVRLLRSRTSLNSSLTGIKFTSVDWEVTKTDQLGLFRKYDHIGTAHGFEFHVQFISREEKDPNSESNEPAFARIIGLRVKVDAQLERPLVPLLTRLSNECDLMGFYQTYSKYCSCLKQRRRTFHELKKAHGKCVHISDDELTDRLHFTVDSGPVLNFSWDVSLAGDGSVNQSVSLTTKTPSNACDEEREYLARLPQLLDKMVKLHGCRDSIVRTLQLLNPLTE